MCEYACKLYTTNAHANYHQHYIGEAAMNKLLLVTFSKTVNKHNPEFKNYPGYLPIFSENNVLPSLRGEKKHSPKPQKTDCRFDSHKHIKITVTEMHFKVNPV